MKNLFIFCLISIYSLTTFSQSQEPYIWSSDYSIGMNRYLSRAVNMDYFSHMLLFRKLENRPRYDSTLKMLVDINAQLIVRASSAWFIEHSFARGQEFHTLNKTLVTDINRAYDNANLRRPIIQAGIFEGVTDLVNSVEIYDDIVNEFLPYMTPTEIALYKTNNISTPKRKFNNENMWVSFSDNNLDIRKIELQMWMFYQAKEHIDAGYKSLHMGQATNVYATSDKDVNYLILERLLTIIRQYAQSKGTFIIMCEEAPYVNGRVSAKSGITGRYLFDFDSRAMRIREFSLTGSPNTSGDTYNCTSPVDRFQFIGTPCENMTYPGVVDPCVINGFGGSTSGIAPNGQFVSQLPYIVHFDFPGISNTPLAASDGSDSNCYGMADTRWFAGYLNPNCQNFWWQKFYCERRNYHDGNGFLLAPGLLLSNPAVGVDFSTASFNLTDNPSLQTTVKDTWAPKVPSLSVVKKITPTNECCTKFKKRELYSYNINITNTSCASYYTIHIKDSYGNWLPFVRGKQILSFQPTINGNYTFIVRQDNMGLSASTFGTTETTFIQYMTSEGCITNNSCRFPATQIRGENQNGELNIFPNPTSNQITIDIDSYQEGNLTFTIFNTLGAVVLEKVEAINIGVNQLELNVQHLTPGVYIINATGKEFYQGKFIKY
jgi:Secretion system C-terminal sorting domain